MSDTRLITTPGWLIRINYWDGDVLDHKMRTELQARYEARTGSLEIRADIDVIKGVDVVACYRNGNDMYGVG
jgi:hypothetical protein